MKRNSGTAWIPVYEYLRQQPPGTEVTWRKLVEVAGHDIRASRTAFVRARAELVKDGLTIGRQFATGVEVVSL